MQSIYVVDALGSSDSDLSEFGNLIIEECRRIITTEDGFLVTKLTPNMKLTKLKFKYYIANFQTLGTT